MNKIIRLTENDLHNLIRKSVTRILKEEYGNTEYTQDNLDQLQDTEGNSVETFFSNKRNARTGFKNAQNPNNRGVYYPFPWGSRNPSDYQKPSPEATTAFNNAHNRMTNYVNGNWHQRMRQKAQQLGNKGIYEAKKNEKNDYEILNGNFGIVTYLSLFDEYVLDYGEKVFYFPNSKHYQEYKTNGYTWKSKKFKNYNDVKKFCSQQNIKIVDMREIKHSLSKGLPDTRSISDNMSQFM